MLCAIETADEIQMLASRHATRDTHKSGQRKHPLNSETGSMRSAFGTNLLLHNWNERQLPLSSFARTLEAILLATCIQATRNILSSVAATHRTEQ